MTDTGPLPMGMLLRPCEVATYLGVSSETLKRWTKAGKIRCVKTPGGHRRYSRVDVERARRQMEIRRDG